MSVTTEKSTIRPFTFEFSDAELEDLRARVKATRWPEKETVTDQSQGPQLETMQKVARYWASDYDWRKTEATLKALPHFITEIDGLDIHFVHVRSKHENALPVIVTHGWPGSIIEQLKLVGPLTDPTAYGGDASDAFHLIIPSMPGYGFSGIPTTTGWGPDRIASAWIELMTRLGYTKYVAQGGDWGAVVTDLMALQAPPELAGIHTNMPGVVPPDIHLALATGNPLPEGVSLSDEEQRTVEQLKYVFTHVYYAYIMASRPQALMALSDSPVGLAAFLMDHDRDSLAMISRSFAGEPEGLTPDDFLDNITLFWLTKTAVSSGRLYAENRSGFFDAKGVTIPVAVSVFPNEIYQAPRSWTEQAYPNLIHYNKLDKGGHFAAWEQPELFVEELRKGFRSLR
ncbi:epoxide hydrolase family protein [Arthrobacter sp. ISL-5]|uniref:epoxide hydrolase family protein n=1 Tax=Arthrobacter sp. ISL-5 TaxID=2819111 RepID=UPI001BE89129|nr:epoxide hydrolase family protein [Arthrobacter sp. ISL-5]MBT2552312.1 epoxide hydrolase [Arthrobacter sp. ISL-5]